jgi:hypothetical protein
MVARRPADIAPGTRGYLLDLYAMVLLVASALHVRAGHSAQPEPEEPAPPRAIRSYRAQPLFRC